MLTPSLEGGNNPVTRSRMANDEEEGLSFGGILRGVQKSTGRAEKKVVSSSSSQGFDISDLLSNLFPNQDKKGGVGAVRKHIVKFHPFRRVVPKDAWWERRFRCSECTTDCNEEEALYFYHRDKVLPACPNPNCKAQWKSWKPEWDDPNYDNSKHERSLAMMEYTVHRECGRKHGPSRTKTPTNPLLESKDCSQYAKKPAFGAHRFVHTKCKKVHGSGEPCSVGTEITKSPEQLLRERKKRELDAMPLANLLQQKVEINRKIVASQQEVLRLKALIEDEHKKQGIHETEVLLVERIIRRREADDKKS
jgi:hypothetical protein